MQLNLKMRIHRAHKKYIDNINGKKDIIKQRLIIILNANKGDLLDHELGGMLDIALEVGHKLNAQKSSSPLRLVDLR